MGRKRVSGPIGLALAILVLVTLALAGLVAPHFEDASRSRMLLVDFDAAYRPENPADDAWPLYQKALFSRVDATSPACYHSRPGDADWEETLKWLDANRGLVPIVVEAARRESYGRPYDTVRLAESWVDFHRREGNADELCEAEQKLLQVSGGIHEIWNGSCSNLLIGRELVNIVCAAAREAAAARDLDRAVTLLDTAANMGRHLIERAFVIDTMIGVAFHGIAGDETRRLLHEHVDDFSPGQLERLADSAVCAYDLPGLETLLEGEWRTMRAVIESGFSDDGAGDGHALVNELYELMNPGIGEEEWWQELLEKAALLLHADKRETLERFDALRETAVAAFIDLALRPEVDRQRDEIDCSRYALLRACHVAETIEATEHCARTAAASRNATAAAVATLRYRLDEGVWPTSAEALVPRYLAALPADVEPGTTLTFVPATDDSFPRWQSAVLRLQEWR